MPQDNQVVDVIRNEIAEWAVSSRMPPERAFEAWCACLLLDLAREQCLGSEYHTGELGN